MELNLVNSKDINGKFYDGFHKESREYSKIINENNFTYTLIVPLLEQLTNKPKINILDYGCGVGTTALYLANKHNFVFGCDISEKAIKIAQTSARNTKLNSRVNFFNSGRTNKLIKNNSIDLIVCLEVIEHVENENELLKLFYSKLKKGGKLLITTPSKYAPLYKLNLLKEFDKRVGHYRRYSKDDLIKLMTSNKMSISRIYENEGIIRNALFTIRPLGFLLKFIKWKIVNVVTTLDNLAVKAFGGSDIIVIAQKI